MKAGIGNLAEILGPEQVVELKSINRWQAIDELVHLLVKTGKLEDSKREAVAVPGCSFLWKPFALPDLMKCVERVEGL